MIGALVGGVFLARQNQNTQKGAYFAGTNLLMMPAEITGAIGNKVDAQLFVETDGAKLSSIDTQICYGQELGFVASPSAAVELNTSALGTLVDASVILNEGYPCLRLIAIADLNKAPADLASGMIRVATIHFKAIATGSGSLKIARNYTKVGGYNPTSGATDSALQVNTITDAAYTITGGTGPTLTPTPITVLSPIHWQAGNVDLQASDFYIEVTDANGKTVYNSKGANVNLHSDPGDSNYTSLEAIWQEHGQEMRTFIYFKSGSQGWWSDEIRTFGAPNQWIYYYGTFFGSPKGGIYNDPSFTVTGSSTESSAVSGRIHFKDLKLKVGFNGLTPTLTPVPTIISNGPVLKFKMTFLGINNGALCATVDKLPLSIIVRAADGTTKTMSDVIAVRETSTDVSALAVYDVSVVLGNYNFRDNLAVFIKSPKSLQVKYGVNGQTIYYNKAGGELSGLTNDYSTTPLFDFTKYPLLAGDVTGQSSTQDGVVDGQDFSFVKTKAIERTEVPAGSYMLADLNGNCKMESQDLAILMLSLKEKQGQLY